MERIDLVTLNADQRAVAMPLYRLQQEAQRAFQLALQAVCPEARIPNAVFDGDKGVVFVMAQTGQTNVQPGPTDGDGHQ